MTAADETMEALRKEASDLKLRVKELGEENRDLSEICNRVGVYYLVRGTAGRALSQAVFRPLMRYRSYREIG